MEMGNDQNEWIGFMGISFMECLMPPRFDIGMNKSMACHAVSSFLVNYNWNGLILCGWMFLCMYNQ